MSAIPIPEMSAGDLARFRSKVRQGDGGACWPWSGAKSGSGYGAFHLAGRMFQAHRVAVKAAGYSVPRWSVIDHVCRNRLCVNPAHLRTVLRGTNIFENSAAPAYLNSIKTHCPKGHPYSGSNLIKRLTGRRGCRACQSAYSRRRRPTGGAGDAQQPPPSR